MELKITSPKVTHFPTLRAYMTQTESTANAGMMDHYKMTGQNCSKKWLGVDSFAEVERLTVEGWPEGAERIMQVAGELCIPPVLSVRRKRIRSDFGDELDIHAVNNGHLENAWFKMGKRNRVTNRRITIVSTINASAATTPEELFWRGATCLALSNALIEAGYDVEIIGAQITYGLDATYSKATALYFPVKHFDEPLVISDLAVVLALSGFFRTYGWLSKFANPFKINHVTGWAEVPRHVGQIKADFANSGSSVVAIDATIMTKEAAMKWLERTIVEIQGKAE